MKRYQFHSILFFIIFCFLLGSNASFGAILTKIAQIRALNNVESEKNYPVSITGIVTFSLPEKDLLFVQDSTGGIFVNPLTKTWDWRIGQKVNITGITAQGSHLPFISRAQIQKLEMDQLPEAKLVTFAQLAQDTEDGNWIKTRGIVRKAFQKENHLILEIAAEGKRLRAFFLEEPESDEHLNQLVDSEVSIRGVAGMVLKDSVNSCFIEIHVPTIADLVVESPQNNRALLAPVVPIASLMTSNAPHALIHRVRIKGIINMTSEGFLNIADETGVAQIQEASNNLIHSNAQAEVFGFPGGNANRPVLEDATVLFIGLSWPESAESLSTSVREKLPILDKIDTIRHMPQKELSRGYPVYVRGTVTFFSPTWQLLFVQDQTAGIYVYDNQFSASTKAGQNIEVTGYTGSGLFAPIIREPSFKNLDAGAMPKATSVTLDQLMSGSQDSQWVEVSGIVHSIISKTNEYHMQIHLLGGTLNVIVQDDQPGDISTNFVDGEVLIRGVCVSQLNQSQRLSGVTLYVPGFDHIHIIRPPNPNPFELPVQSIHQLLQFQPQRELRHRIHVRGTVTYKDTRYYTLFIQEGTSPLYIQCLHKPDVEIGDEIDAVGFVITSSFRLEMSETVYHRRGKGVLPEPISLNPAQAVSGLGDSQLMTLEGRLVERVPGTKGYGLVMQGSDWNFLAYLEETQPIDVIDTLKQGSLLQLTGVGCMQNVDRQAINQLVLHLRTPNDVRVLKTPSWWKLTHWLILLGALILTIGIISVWVALLHKNIQIQTQVIRAKLEQEAALEARYQELFENVKDIILSMDVKGKITLVNPAFEKTLGYSLVEAVQLNFSDLVHPDDLSNCQSLLKQAILGNGTQLERMEMRLRGKQNQIIDVVGSCAISQKDGKTIAIRGIFHDITTRKNAEEILKRSEAQLSAIYDGVPLMICLVNGNCQIERMNRTMQKYVESDPIPREKMEVGSVLRCLNTVNHKDTCGTGFHCTSCALRLSILTTFETGTPCEQVEQHMTFFKENKPVSLWVAISTTLVNLENGARVLVCLADITARKQLEAQFFQAQKMEAVGQLAGGVAHDFNNILTVIMMNISFLKELTNNDPSLIDGLNELEKQGNRATNLTRQLLLFSRRQAMETKRLDLNELLNGLMKMLSRLIGEDIKLEIHPFPNALWINADPGMMEQMIVNLCVNARDAMPKGGQIKIITELIHLRPQDVLQQRDARVGTFVRLSVQDTGCGMTEEIMARIFEPFFTTKGPGKGTGLGLATVHGIVKQHRGWVEVDSVIGMGTTFRIYIPADSKPLEQPQTKKTSAILDGTETILVVEDESSLRRIVKQTLSRHGYRVLEAQDGVHALEIWKKHHQEIQLLFSDMVMPSGLTGLELAEELSRLKPDLKIVITSGYTTSNSPTTIPTGVKLLSKPFTPEALASIIRNCLDERPATNKA